MRLKKEEEYLIGESQEVEAGLYPRALRKFFKVFPALSGRNYQLYFSGQLISLVGTWLQIVALGWLILRLTGSAFMVGAVAAAATVPTLIFSLVGGVVVDRFSKKKIILITQTSEMVLAFILGVLTILKIINVNEIIIISVLIGLVMAVDSPARQSFVIEMVGKTNLTSAIALNSGIFNAARIIGPSLAGLLISTFGEGGSFILNAVSFIAVIIALIFIQVEEKKVSKTKLQTFTAIKEGVVYSLKNYSIRNLLALTAVISLFGWTFTTILPVITKDVFNLGAQGLGYLYAAIGVGALLSSIIISAFSQKLNRDIFIFGGGVFFALSILFFSFSKNFSVSLIFLFFAGLGLLSQFSMINTDLQHLVDDYIRGRVMSIYTLLFIGLAPFGNLQLGYLAEKFGPFFPIRIGAIIVLFFSIFMFLIRNRKA